MKQLIKLGTLLTTVLVSHYAYSLPDDINQPLEIQADEASFDQSVGEAIYKGNVFVKQGSIEIQAQYLKVSTDINTRTFSNLTASGTPAKFSQKVDLNNNIIIGKGDDIHYSTSKSKLEILGNGYLSRMDNSISADHIIYMINEGTFSAEKTDTGRVSMTLQPQAEKANK